MLPETTNISLDIFHNGPNWGEINQGDPKVIQAGVSIFYFFNHLDELSNKGQNYFVRYFVTEKSKDVIRHAPILLVPDKTEGFYRLVIGSGIKRPICFANVIYYDEKDQQFQVFGLEEEGEPARLTRQVEVVEGSFSDSNTKFFVRNKQIQYVLYKDGVRKGRLLGFEREGDVPNQMAIIRRMQVVGINPLLRTALNALFQKNIVNTILATSEEFLKEKQKKQASTISDFSCLQMQEHARLDGDEDGTFLCLRYQLLSDSKEVFSERKTNGGEKEDMPSLLSTFCDLTIRENIADPIYLDRADDRTCLLVHRSFPASEKAKSIEDVLRNTLLFGIEGGELRTTAAVVKELMNMKPRVGDDEKIFAIDIIRLFYKSCFTAISTFRNAFYMARFTDPLHPIMMDITKVYLREGIEMVKTLATTQFPDSFGEGVKLTIEKTLSLVSMLELPMEALLSALNKQIILKSLVGINRKKVESQGGIDSVFYSILERNRKALEANDKAELVRVHENFPAQLLILLNRLNHEIKETIGQDFDIKEIHFRFYNGLRTHIVKLGMCMMSVTRLKAKDVTHSSTFSVSELDCSISEVTESELEEEVVRPSVSTDQNEQKVKIKLEETHEEVNEADAEEEEDENEKTTRKLADLRERMSKRNMKK